MLGQNRSRRNQLVKSYEKICLNQYEPKMLKKLSQDDLNKDVKTKLNVFHPVQGMKEFLFKHDKIGESCGRFFRE